MAQRLVHACRHVAQGSIVHTVIRPRRQIPGAALWPFGTLPKSKRHFVRRQRLVDRVRALEAELVADLHAFNVRMAKFARLRRR